MDHEIFEPRIFRLDDLMPSTTCDGGPQNQVLLLHAVGERGRPRRRSGGAPGAGLDRQRVTEMVADVEAARGLRYIYRGAETLISTSAPIAITAIAGSMILAFECGQKTKRRPKAPRR